MKSPGRSSDFNTALRMANLDFWGVTASPFQLKMQSLADYADFNWRRLPSDASLRESLVLLWRLRNARSTQSIKRFPQPDTALAEYPSVPFYTFDGRQIYYDSTGLALHLDTLESGPAALVPTDPKMAFLCRLIDEAFDEFGLYMAHHNRWVTSAKTNVMASTTVAEFGHMLPFFVRAKFRRTLARRQVGRCPYLFSVAPAEFDCAMPKSLTPPAREGFPATHELLDVAWRRYLDALEHLLSRQPFLLGERFTLADASVFGQLAMNLPDGRAAHIMAERAPTTFRWLRSIAAGEHSRPGDSLCAADNLAPLIACISATFIPLMQQNEAAYLGYLAQGQQRFNEAAFDAGEALYAGQLLGRPFRAVAKTFQVETWRNLRTHWHQLHATERSALVGQYPDLALLVAQQQQI